jgi:hypothetical protein
MSLPPAREPAPPPAVPGYVVETLLGRGGSGEVWRAVPRGGGPAVAVKLLLDGDPEAQAREAALLGALDHPHLVRVHEVVHQPRRGDAPRVALVLDLLDGGSLAALLARRGRLRPGEVVTTVAPVASAVAHAHAQGVIHGDLSPGNIVFTAEGRPVLTDLGVARVLGEASSGQVTPAYVDPVVARGGAAGPASDVFGLAAAAFHALTGIAPWNAATPADVLEVAASGHLPDLAELAPDAPDELLAVVARGLAPDPHVRGSAAAFALDLRHACRPEPVRLAGAGVLGADGSHPERPPGAELTHQVPGHRPRPAPRVVEPAGRRRDVRDRWRAAGGRHGPSRLPAAAWRPVLAAAAALAVAAGLALAVDRLSAGAQGPGRAATAVSAAADVGPQAPERGSAAAASGTPEEPAPPLTVRTPTSPAGWRALLGELYAARAEAWATGSADRLVDVYTDGSRLLAADRAGLAELCREGSVLRGFRPEVVEVTAAVVDGRRAEVQLVDRWSEHAVVPDDGGVARPIAGRGEQQVAMVLVRTAEGWRIETAERPG